MTHRRIAPLEHQAALGQKQISQNLGDNDAEAMANYAPLHEKFETLFAKPPVDVSSKTSSTTKQKIETYFVSINADLRSAGATEDERLARQEKRPASRGSVIHNESLRV